MADPIIETMECRHGHMQWLSGDLYIGTSLREYGEWCEPEVELMGRFLKPGDNVIESGSNIGADTVPLAKLVGPTGHVTAIEPQLPIFKLLCSNLKLNDLKNVRAFQCGTHSKAARASVPILDYGSEAYNFGGVMIMKPGLGEDVPLSPVDEMLPPDHKVALIKADVEGMELPTLIGASKTIGNNRPVLYLENNPGPLSAALIRFLTQINYRCWWHTVKIFQPTNFRGSTEDLFPEVYSVNMLCLPTNDDRLELVGDLKPVISPRDVPPGFAPRRIHP